MFLFYHYHVDYCINKNKKKEGNLFPLQLCVVRLLPWSQCTVSHSWVITTSTRTPLQFYVILQPFVHMKFPMHIYFKSTVHIINANKRPGIWHTFHSSFANFKNLSKNGVKTFSSDVASSLSRSPEPLPYPPFDFPTLLSLLSSTCDCCILLLSKLFCYRLLSHH